MQVLLNCIISLAYVIQPRAELTYYAHIRSIPNLQQNSIFMAYIGSNICVIRRGQNGWPGPQPGMEKQAHSTFVLVAPSEILVFCGFNPHFL